MLGKLLLFVHVLGAIVWMGGGLLFQAATERAVVKRDRAAGEAIARVASSLGSAYFIVPSLAVLAAGIALVFSLNWGFDQPFIIGGLIGWFASVLVGARLIGPASESLQGDVAGGSATDVSVIEGIKRLRNIGRVDLVIMTTVVYLMTVKPGS